MAKEMTSLRRACMAAIVAGLGLAAVPALACQVPGGATGMRDGVIAWMNAERAARGLGPLRGSETLQNSATGHACDMAAREFFAHEGPGGPNLAQRLRGAGYRFRAGNENIAKTSTDSVDRVAAIWRASPGHMGNVLDPKVREVGVGLAVANGSFYWVTNAGSR